jgi:hypothetical protein
MLGKRWGRRNEQEESLIRSFFRLAVFSLFLILLFAPVTRAASQPYGANDAGGFRNVLPPGENGLDTLSQIFSFRGLGTLPPHFADQQPLYENLVYGSPELTDEKVPSYFKDATFGVAPG